MSSFYLNIVLLIIFLAVFIAVYLILNNLMPSVLDKRIAILIAPREEPEVKKITNNLSLPVKKWIESLAKVAMGKDPWLTSPLRVRFSNAGLNNPKLVTLYLAVKSLLAIAMPIGAFIVYLGIVEEFNFLYLLVVMLLASAIGYYAPDFLLTRLVKRRQQELFEVFPDALDLLRVCIEAGLGLDAAVERVGRELQIESRSLAQEFLLLGLELRAGASRKDALQNLALRVGLEDVDSLASMLIQTDRFGTSIADSLKVHSESLRSKRKLIAEEKAAKLPVKILMPLIFCVFPALLTVLLGPAVINVAQVLLPMMAQP